MEDVALVVAKVVGVATFGGVDIGEVIKVEALSFELRPVHFGFAGRVIVGQNASVFAQGMVDIAHEVVEAAVLAVVVAGAAFVGTEFFIGPAFYSCVALEACAG